MFREKCLMPLVHSAYKPKGLFKIAAINTIYGASLRQVSLPPYERERLNLPDGDFLDLDWSLGEKSSEKLVVLMHGLAGSAQRPYIKGMARIFRESGWDVVAVNFRGCSEEINRRYRSYHGGASEDLDTVISHVLHERDYTDIGLIGFSLGGNVLLKYLGEDRPIPPEVKAAVGISVPCDLAGSLKELERMRNFIFQKRFVQKLKTALRHRSRQFPDKLHLEDVSRCNSLREIDELYTAKAHGFADAEDYYNKNSSLAFLPHIKHPTLLINAWDDSFLCPLSYPISQAKTSAHLYLETPQHGGHISFVLPGNTFFHEKRALDHMERFVQS